MLLHFGVSMRIEEAFGGLVKKLRLDRGLTQPALALSAGVTERYLRDLEQGKKSPTLTVVVSLASSLEVDAHELVKQAVSIRAE